MQHEPWTRAAAAQQVLQQRTALVAWRSSSDDGAASLLDASPLAMWNAHHLLCHMTLPRGAIAFADGPHQWSNVTRRATRWRSLTGKALLDAPFYLKRKRYKALQVAGVAGNAHSHCECPPPSPVRARKVVVAAAAAPQPSGWKVGAVVRNAPGTRSLYSCSRTACLLTGHGPVGAAAGRSKELRPS